jgi:hypothetical protein
LCSWDSTKSLYWFSFTDCSIISPPPIFGNPNVATACSKDIRAIVSEQYVILCSRHSLSADTTQSRQPGRSCRVAKVMFSAVMAQYWHRIFLQLSTDEDEDRQQKLATLVKMVSEFWATHSTSLRHMCRIWTPSIWLSGQHSCRQLSELLHELHPGYWLSGVSVDRRTYFRRDRFPVIVRRSMSSCSPNCIAADASNWAAVLRVRQLYHRATRAQAYLFSVVNQSREHLWRANLHAPRGVRDEFVYSFRLQDGVRFALYHIYNISKSCPILYQSTILSQGKKSDCPRFLNKALTKMAAHICSLQPVFLSPHHSD